MRRLRDLLTFVFFFTLLGISLYAGMRAWRTGLPVVAQDHREELRRVLAEGPVEDLPIGHRRKLLRQLEAELRDGVNWQEELNQVQPRKRNLVANNIASLATLWLEEKMDEYFSLPSGDERDHFVDREIQRVSHWQTTQSLRNRNDARTGDAERALAKAVSQRLMSGALLSRPDQKLRLAIFLNDVQSRWRSQGLGGLVPSGAGERE